MSIRSIAAVVLLVASGVGLVIAPTSAQSPPSCTSMPSQFMQEFCQHFQHVVFIVMENHAYDNFFATYCLAASVLCNGAAHGIPPGTCEFEANYTGTGYPTGSCPKGYVNPWDFGPKNFTTTNLNHNEASTVESICGTATSNTACLSHPPKMDGYWLAEGKKYTTFGHYDGLTTPIYWDIAQESALGDNIYSSDPSYSLPNHWFMLAGQAPARSQFFLLNTAQEHSYLDQANKTRTFQDVLNSTPGVTWKYYDWTLAKYKTAISGSQSNAYGKGSAYSYWNPLAGRAESYDQWYSNHFVNRTPTFFTDLSQNPSPSTGLPNISWVIPDKNFSDHPSANITQGESFVANVIDSIERSSYWKSTAVFLTWDDYGGFYDHMAPPKLPGLNSLGLSFRVPFLVISPYTPAGLISHQVGYFDSVLRMFEQRWGMGCVVPSLPTQDCNAPILSSFFDFQNITSPRSPCLFPTNPSLASYPMTCSLTPAQVPLDTTSWVGSDQGLNATEAD